MQPICPFFYECGGCDRQDVPYKEQIVGKEKTLQELFSPLAGPELWKSFLASSEEYPIFFRNKIRFSFVEYKGKVWPSRHPKGSSTADIPVDECFLESPLCNEIMLQTADFATRHGWSLYDPEKGKGWLKHLLVRHGKYTNEVLLSLVTDHGPIEGEALWIKEITNRFPEVKSLYHTTSWGRSNEQLEDRLLWGDEFIHEKIGEYLFQISPHAFFQTNSLMVETLYKAVEESAELTGKEMVWDLYAGSATIGIFLSKKAREVIAVENHSQNIKDATVNLILNSVENVKFAGGKVEDIITSQFLRDTPRPDVVVVDPPRAGLSEQIRGILPHIGPQRLIYVSCNPLTCLHDCRDLLKKGYALESLQGIDMFPHTGHCEMIAVLKK